MNRAITALIVGISILAFAACGGSSDPEPTHAPTATPLPTPTATPLLTATPTPPPLPTPTSTPEPAGSVSLGESVAACLEARIGVSGAESALSNLATPTPDQEAALSECLLAASLGTAGEEARGGQATDPGILACLAEQLGESVARAVASGLIPLNAEESAILGACGLSAAATASAGTTDPIIACLENDLDAGLARLVASGAVPLSAAQEALLGNCVLSTSLGSTSATLSADVAACLESALGVESARVAASGSDSLSSEQQAALGGCLLGSALTGPADGSGDATSGSTNLTSGVLTCLTQELGADVAQVVASAALPLSAAEEQILGNCVLKDALGLNP